MATRRVPSHVGCLVRHPTCAIARRVPCSLPDVCHRTLGSIFSAQCVPPRSGFVVGHPTCATTSGSLLAARRVPSNTGFLVGCPTCAIERRVPCWLPDVCHPAPGSLFATPRGQPTPGSLLATRRVPTHVRSFVGHPTCATPRWVLCLSPDVCHPSFGNAATRCASDDTQRHLAQRGTSVWMHASITSGDAASTGDVTTI